MAILGPYHHTNVFLMLKYDHNPHTNAINLALCLFLCDTYVPCSNLRQLWDILVHVLDSGVV